MAESTRATDQKLSTSLKYADCRETAKSQLHMLVSDLESSICNQQWHLGLAESQYFSAGKLMSHLLC